ncbi:hypothetical protein R1sor_004110 [Riccia sorocarpa]|uniref:Beta-lactamase-related domain-containing protein n=1 Tax=Riccia sorocarpa TaxID=122646 RepID=A0ABD3H3K3_9MARC
MALMVYSYLQLFMIEIKSRQDKFWDYNRCSRVIYCTYGYLDPEYFSENRLTRKSDVYSFGASCSKLLAVNLLLLIMLDPIPAISSTWPDMKVVLHRLSVAVKLQDNRIDSVGYLPASGAHAFGGFNTGFFNTSSTVGSEIRCADRDSITFADMESGIQSAHLLASLNLAPVFPPIASYTRELDSSLLAPKPR